jgi:hypothetical protein
MNHNPKRYILTVATIGAMILGPACGTVTDTNVSNSNVASNTKVADLGPCELEWTDAERAKIELDIATAIRGKGVEKKLKKSLDGDGGKPPWLRFEVRRSPGVSSTGVPDRYYEAVFYGSVAGNAQFEELADILNDFNGKKECVRRAVFLPTSPSPGPGPGPSPTPTPLAPALRAVGFEWTACDYPMRPCSTGECACN